MSEYGKQKDLTEILEDLAFHCFLVDPKTPNIKIILPKKVIENFSKSFTPMERIKTPSEVPQKDATVIKSLYVNSGRVELFNDEENEITVKELV